MAQNSELSIGSRVITPSRESGVINEIQGSKPPGSYTKSIYVYGVLVDGGRGGTWYYEARHLEVVDDAD